MPASEEEVQCQQEQQEEYAGLQAIFGEHSCLCDALTGELKARRLELNFCLGSGTLQIHQGPTQPGYHTALQVTVPDAESQPRLLLRCERPCLYPIRDPPYPVISAGHLSQETCEWAQDRLLQQFVAGMSKMT